MKLYDSDDTATFYFVVSECDNTKSIQAWTDSKKLAEFYMDFHKCPRFRLKKVTKRYKDLIGIINDNNNDEIVIGNIYMKDTSKKNDNTKIVSIPITQTEITFVSEETETFLSSRIGYSYMNDVIPYLKNKYQEALSDIFLTSLIKKAVYNKNDKINQSIKFDQLIILFRSFPDYFGI